MLNRLGLPLCLFLSCLGVAEALAQDIGAIRAEIDSSPFMSTGPVIDNLELRDGYLFATVQGVSKSVQDSLLANVPLEMIVASDQSVAGLMRLEAVLLEEFDLKAVYWTPIPAVPAERRTFFDTLAGMVVEPDAGMGTLRLGDQVLAASIAIDAEIVRDTEEIKTAKLEMGAFDLYLYAKSGSRITAIRLIDNLVFDHGAHGVRVQRAMRDMLPRTVGGIGLGSTREEVVAAMGPPAKSEMWTLGGCGIRNRTDEMLLYSGLRLRLCDGIVTDLEVN